VTASRAQVAAAALALAALFAAQTVALFVRPPTDPLRPADAVVVFHPSRAGPVEAAELVEDGLAPTLIVIREPGHGPVPVCDERQPFPVRCFYTSPERAPLGTRSQIREALGVAGDHGHRSVIVVVPAHKSVRARLLTSRCAPGPVQIAPVRVGARAFVAREWPALVYTWLFLRGC
jgi:hypothetical protein